MKPPKDKREFTHVMPIVVTLVVLTACAIAYAIYAEYNADQFVLPYGYTGKVKVIYNQKNGVSIQQKDRKRLFFVPSDGVLLIQCDYERTRAAQFYFLMPDSSLEPIFQGYTLGSSGMMMTTSADSFLMGDVEYRYVDSVKGEEVVFTVMKHMQ